MMLQKESPCVDRTGATLKNILSTILIPETRTSVNPTVMTFREPPYVAAVGGEQALQKEAVPRARPALTLTSQPIELSNSPNPIDSQERIHPAHVSKQYNELAETWGEFLGAYPFDLFATLTFKDCTHPETADKIHENFIHMINRDCYGQHYWKDKTKGVFYARGTEYQRRGVIHYHDLIGGVPDFARVSKYLNWWKAYVAPQCTIEKYDASKGGRYYLAKSAYTFKRGEIDVNDAMVHESQGDRTCAKVLHNEFVEAYVSENRLLRAEPSSYRW